MKALAFSHKGKRDINQDYVLVEDIENSNQLCLIADGMGGLTAGDIAAKIVGDNILTYLNNTQTIDHFHIQKAVNKATLAIRQKSKDLNQKMGATVGAVILHNNLALCFWVGDVQIFHFRNFKLINETIPHTMVNQLKESGSIHNLENLKRYEHVVTRAIDGNIDSSEVDFLSIEFDDTADIIIICSDGITDVYNGIQIEALLDSSENPVAALSRLEQELSQLASDNFSIIILYN